MNVALLLSITLTAIHVHQPDMSYDAYEHVTDSSGHYRMLKSETLPLEYGEIAIEKDPRGGTLYRFWDGREIHTEGKKVAKGSRCSVNNVTDEVNLIKIDGEKYMLVYFPFSNSWRLMEDNPYKLGEVNFNNEAYNVMHNAGTTYLIKQGINLTDPEINEPKTVTEDICLMIVLLGIMVMVCFIVWINRW